MGLRIERRLAVGGMAEVFVAMETLADGSTRKVALKRLLPGADEVMRELFARERACLARVASAHVVALLGGEGDQLVLEYVDGPNLGALIAHLGRRGRTLPLPACLAALEGLLTGLADLHEAREADGRPMGMVHRDVNPANVLIGRDGAVKLTDLGVVRADLAEMPTVGGLKGTLAYMAPEQLRGREVSQQTDLYAAGLVAYEALTGVAARPAGMVGVAELLEARSRLPAPPSRVRPGLSEALDRAVLAALQPDPAARPTSARGWLAELLAAAGVAPDGVALARAADDVDDEAALPTRTLAPSPELPAAAAAPEAPTRPATRGRAGLFGAAALLVVGIGALAFWLAGRSPPAPPEALRPAIAAAPPEVASTTSEAPDARASPPLADIGPSRDATPDEASTPVDSDPATALPEADPAPELPPAAHEPRRPPPKPLAASEPSTREIRLELRQAGAGPVHVTGAGANGLAPVNTAPLAEGAHLLRLVGGRAALPAVLRVVRNGERLDATLGAPPGRYYTVRCGGRDLGHTPVRGLPVGAGLRCELATAEGDAMAFSLVPLRR